ncbi:hypothetical protein L195_g044263 [Trifolium pratense]|uniref:Reverse transcriptase zinc-binding domain-containing protein n=2 Tax=Trifolium pratense TaxID=57577 RepID=A0A2K3MBK6_TRIPR|nr:hypothetical protein L195_g044263 [Trifolium pratense]
MMTSIIPKACVDEIQKMQRRFIWGDTEHSRKYHAIGWDIMTKPKDCGGLGLRRLTVMNKACILKLGRKLQTGSQEFWCNVMWGKYRRGSTNNNVVAKTLDSHLWKSIVKLWPKLDELCFWTIRDGKSVDCYWYSQVWIEEGLRVADLNLNIPDSLRDLKVTQLVDDEGRWKLEVLAACLPVSLLHMIAAIPPPEESAGADSAYCMEDTAGNFSISAMYHPLYRFDDSNGAANWKHIWKIKVQERVRVFVWLMYHERILTNYQKNRMGLGSSMCDFCGDQVETILHVMRDCPLVMPLWLNLVHSNMRRNFCTGYTQQWIDFNLNVDVRGQFDVEWKSIWAISCHFAWSWRNKEKHGLNFIRPIAPTMVVMNVVRNYVVADDVLHIDMESRKVEKLISWKPPPVGWVRLNTDGARK